MLLLTLLMTATAWADDYVWDATTKTLTVNTNPTKGLNNNYDIEHLVIGSSVTSIGNESFLVTKTCQLSPLQKARNWSLSAATPLGIAHP